jgi:hypothetical protein
MGWILPETGLDLDGWEDWGAFTAPDGSRHHLPLWHDSVDAILRDVVPECQRQGWEFELRLLYDGTASCVMWNRAAHDGDASFENVGTPAEAFALACLAALEGQK